MHRSSWVGFGAGLFVVAALTGCGGRAQDEGLMNVEPNIDSCTKSGVDGVTCYPSKGIGTAPRVGDVYGDRISNRKFVGFRSTTSAAPVDTTKGTTVVQMADYFDPTASTYSLIVLDVCTRWCGPCSQLADEFASWRTTLYAQAGVAIIEVLTQGLDYKPSTVADLIGFIGDHSANFTVVMDPSAKFAGSRLGDLLDDREAVPLIAVIDPRTMEILYRGVGVPYDLPKFLDMRLEQIQGRPPKP